MLTPPQLVWVAHGSPVVDRCEEAGGRCYLCGGSAEKGSQVARWMPPTFNDQWRALGQGSDFVCEACCYIASRHSAVLGRPPKDGKAFGANFRNVSHLWEAGWCGVQAPNYANASKGEKSLIREFLRREHSAPWFAAVADTGQLHVLPFARVNGPGRSGVVAFETMLVEVPHDVSLVDEVILLLTSGATKAEIESADYRDTTWRRCEDSVRAFENARRVERGGGWFALALWLAQRDEAKVQERLAREKEERRGSRSRKGTARGDSQRASGAQRSVHENVRTQPSQALAEIGAATAPESERRIVDGPMAGEDPIGTRDREHEQLALFGDGIARQKPRTKRS